ncbi:MAG: AGE family epimerase/isomerase [Fimbriimonadales bacterium]
MITLEGRREIAVKYRTALLDDVIPFWLRHGIDREHAGFLTALARDGTVADTDKSIWFQGRGAWMFATLYNTVEQKGEWLEAARSGVEFLRDHGFAPDGKMYFTVTREGKPLRMRRYAYSESFAAIANAALAKATGDTRCAADAEKCWANYLRYSLLEGYGTPKVNPQTRPMMGLGPRLIGIATAQEMRENLGEVSAYGRNCTEWIDSMISEIETYFMKPNFEAVMEVVGPKGEIIDGFDGRLLNPGHSLEAAWFILHEGKLRSDARLVEIGCTIIDWMWKRGWDEEHGGLRYYDDLKGLPIQEYWHDMKFWWPHCEAIIATALAWKLTSEKRYARWHCQVHDWSFAHFADPEFGEWYGYLHRDGSVSSQLKGSMFKGPFHLPRALWYCWKLLEAGD